MSHDHVHTGTAQMHLRDRSAWQSAGRRAELAATNAMQESVERIIAEGARHGTLGASQLLATAQHGQPAQQDLEVERAFADTMQTLRAMQMCPVPVDVLDAALTTARLLVHADKRRLSANELETVFAVTWKSVQRSPNGFSYKQLGAFTFARRRTRDERALAEVRLLKRFDWKLHLLCGPCKLAEFLLVFACKHRICRVSRRQYIRCRHDIRRDARAWLESSAEMHLSVIDAAVRIAKRHTEALNMPNEDRVWRGDHAGAEKHG